MYKVLIVDDELLVRTNIKLLIDWESEDFSLCGEAGDGHKALQLIKTHQPNIVITDMHMPIMDGLQLCKKLQEEYPEIIIIVLSNYDDFEFVRGALKYGALDYLLKNTLSSEILASILSKAKKHLLERKNTEPTIALSPDNLTALRKSFITKLLTTFYSNEHEIHTHLSVLNLKLDTKNIIPIVMSVDSYESMTGGLANRNITEFSIQNITEEILSENSSGIVCYQSNGLFTLLLSYSTIFNQQTIDNKTISLIEQIASTLEKFLNLTVSFSIGDTCPSILNIQSAYERAEQAIKSKFYYGDKCIIIGNDAIKNEDTIIGLEIKYEKELIHHVESLNLPDVQQVLHTIFAKIKEDKTSITNCQLIFNDLMSIIGRISKHESIDLTQVYPSQYSSSELIGKLENLDKIKGWFERSFENLITHLNDNIPETINSKYVKIAVKMITKKYQTDISLQSIADNIGISSSYLSTNFKKEVGIGFTEYVINFRLNKAKLLIESGNTDYKEIIKLCGFNDYNYFFKIFKKKVGTTPNKYASKHSR